MARKLGLAIGVAEASKLVLVGDRGMITTARIDALRELNNNPDIPTISIASCRSTSQSIAA